jgi:hypothetical protein
MSNSYAIDHLRPGTIAQLIAELIADHAEEMDTGEFNFNTEDAKNAYAELLDAGIRRCGHRRIFDLIEVAVDEELGRKEG